MPSFWLAQQLLCTIPVLKVLVKIELLEKQGALMRQIPEGKLTFKELFQIEVLRRRVFFFLSTILLSISFWLPLEAQSCCPR